MMQCRLTSLVKIELSGGSCRQGHPVSWLAGETGSSGLCPFLFNAAYPYFVTLLNGGWFTWVPPGGTVIAQCGNPDGAVELEIGRRISQGTPVVFARVRRVRGVCPQGYESASAFEFTLEDLPFCPKALGAFVPYLAVVARGGALPWKNEQGNFTLCCPDAMCDALFTMERVTTSTD